MDPLTGIFMNRMLIAPRRLWERAAMALSMFFFGYFPAWSQYLNIPPQASGFVYPPRGTAGDLWADLILGQIDYGDIQKDQTDQNHLASGGSVVVDTLPGHNMMWVQDYGNNRVLGVQMPGGTGVNGLGATVVLGQPDFSHTGSNWDGDFQNYPQPTLPSAYSLGFMPQNQTSIAEGGDGVNMAVDGQGNLYVADFQNNRVLRYDWSASSGITTGQPASHVWGQTSFSGLCADAGTLMANGSCGSASPSAAGLSFNNSLYITGVATDSWGNLWVADSGNGRVLRFPNPGSGIPSATADVVLGQPNFTSPPVSPASQTDPAYLGDPLAVRVDNQGNVYAADNTSFGGRILAYAPTGVTGGGQPTYTNGEAAGGVMTQYLYRPTGLEWDAPVNGGVSNGLWVTDVAYNDIVLFQVGFNAGVFSAAPQKILLRDRYTDNNGSYGCGGGSTGDAANNYFTDNYGNQTTAWVFCAGMEAVGVDAQDNVYIFNGLIQDVWGFPEPIPTPQAGIAHSATIQIFKPRWFGMTNNMGPQGLNIPKGVAVAWGDSTLSSAGPSSVPRQLIATDAFHFMFWDMPTGSPGSLTLDQAPTGFVGTGDPTIPNPGGDGFERIREDQAQPQQHLWVSRTKAYSGYIQIYNLPLNSASVPVTALGPSLPLLGGGSVSLWDVTGLAPAPDASYIWLSDVNNNRVLRVQNPLTSPVVDVILGQPTTASIAADYPSGNPTATNMSGQGSVVLDHHGYLYVSDHYLEITGENNRVLRWNPSTLAAAVSNASAGNTVVCGLPADAVYGVGGLTNFNSFGCVNPNNGKPYVCGPMEPAFSADDSLMVLGMDGYSGERSPVVFQNFETGESPVSTLNDYYSEPYSDDVDDHGNLYINDTNRSRILVYDAFFPTAIPTATFTPTPTPIVTGTPTPTPTPTITPTPTDSPTPVPETSICLPYPNPVRTGQLSCCYTVAGPSNLRWKIFTTAFRKIADHEEPVSSGGTLLWDLRDQSGAAVANGLYYLRVEIVGPQPMTKILKVLVIR